jgi:amino acid adenylation domain-containing protein
MPQLDTPADRPREDAAGAADTWHRARSPLAAPATLPQFATVVAAALARIAGAETVPLGLHEGDGSRIIAVAVNRDESLAQLAERIAAAEPLPDGTGAPQVWIGPPDGQSPSGAELVARLDDDGRSLLLDGDARLYEPGTVERLAARLARGVDAVTAGTAQGPADLPLLSADERRTYIDELNDTSAPFPGAATYALLAENARSAPDDIAVIWSGGELTLAELHRAARALASDLIAAGVRPGGMVRTFLPRSPELVVAWLAVLAAGAVCVPLDPGYPPERLRLLLADSGTGPVVVRPGGAPLDAAGGTVLPIALRDLLDRPEQTQMQTPTAPLPEVAQDDLAYVIFTSGSTGRPKGVRIEHRGLVNLLHATARPFGLEPGRRALFAGSPSFDITVWEIFAPLYAGATLVIHDEPEVRADRLARTVAAHHVDTVFLLSSMVAQLDPAAFPGVRTVITGGDSFNQALVDRWQPGRDLIYVYGPTEATVIQSWHRCVAGAAGEPPSVGRPFANFRFHILDRLGAVAVPGAVGELFISGAGVGRGYMNASEGAASAFTEDPAGERVYRSGDLASYRPDGTIDFRGRADGQVKIRGFRVELGEVEAALAGQPGVTAAAAIVRSGPGGEPFLVGYVRTDGARDPAALRTAVAEKLPYYMVPAVVTVLPELPATPNGKVDRRALARLPLDAPQPAAPAHQDAVTPTEALIRRAFASELPEVAVDADTNFFLHGGGSLAAATLAHALGADLGVPVRIRDLFECPTPAALAARLADRGAPAPALTNNTEPRGDANEDAILRWMWLERQLRPVGFAGYNVPALYEGHGDVEPDRLAAAVAAVQRRHPVLRTILPTRAGRPELLVGDGVAPWEVVRVADRASLDREVDARANASFDLATGPLLRTTLLLGPAGRWWLLLVADHVVSDGRSLEILPEEIAAAYAGALDAQPPERTDAPPAPTREATLAYWRDLLTPAPPSLPLPIDRPRGSGIRSAPCSNLRVDFDAQTTAGLRDLARNSHGGQFAVASCAVAVALQQLTGVSDVCLGTAVDRRASLGRIGHIGCHVTTVPLRVRVTDDVTSRQLVADVARQAFDAADHSGVTFDEMAAELALAAAPGRHPLFDVWVSCYTETHVPSAGGVGFTGGPVPIRAGKLDLAFLFHDGGAGAGLTLRYDRELYDEATANALARRVAEAARRLSAAPDAAALGGRPDRPPRERAFAGFRFA